jgi:hypothetical protein
MSPRPALALSLNTKIGLIWRENLLLGAYIRVSVFTRKTITGKPSLKITQSFRAYFRGEYVCSRVVNLKTSD